MDDGKSYAEKMAELPEDVRAALRAQMTPEAAESLKTNWRFWARPKQLPPPGDWATWLLLAGRGFGKTRAGAEWVSQMASRRRKTLIVCRDCHDDIHEESSTWQDSRNRTLESRVR